MIPYPPGSHSSLVQMIMYESSYFYICLMCLCLAPDSDNPLSFWMLNLAVVAFQDLCMHRSKQYKSLSVFVVVYVCLHICVHPCMLVLTTENLWVTLCNVRPRGSVKYGHGLKLKSTTAGMAACWS